MYRFTYDEHNPPTRQRKQEDKHGGIINRR